MIHMSSVHVLVNDRPESTKCNTGLYEDHGFLYKYLRNKCDADVIISFGAFIKIVPESTDPNTVNALGPSDHWLCSCYTKRSNFTGRMRAKVATSFPSHIVFEKVIRVNVPGSLGYGL